MKKAILTLWCHLFALIVLCGTPAHAGPEEVILSATAATSTQTSSEFRIQEPFKNYLLFLDVTAGSTLLLDVSIDMHLGGPDVWTPLIADLPSGAGTITGTGLTVWIISQTTAFGDASADSKRIPIGGNNRVVVTHGNANEATYELYIQAF